MGITLSIDSSVRLEAVNNLADIRYLNETSKHWFIYRAKIADIRQGMEYKISNNRSNNRPDNKAGHEFGNGCGFSPGGKGCVISDLFSMGTTSSYIEEYSMFAVIGTGIKLPEEQIESFNGIDD